MSDTAPPADRRVVGALAPFLTTPDVVTLLAVSGGPDSTALLHAASRAGAAGRLHVATVDHGLRPDSAQEAEAVGRMAAALGLPHAILTWTSPRSGSRIQATARTARYHLLAEQADRVGATRLMTAHTRDDQAETVLMRLLAGSGLAGLAGMRRVRALTAGVRLVRPFLDLPKAELIAYCEAHRLPYVQDPSNTDERFGRARMRRLAASLADEGLSTDRLVRLAARSARDEAALSQLSMAILSEMCHREGEWFSLDGHRLCREPEAVALRVVDAALDAAALACPQVVPKRLERLESLVIDAILPALRAGTPLRRTLRGVLVETDRHGAIRLRAAPPRRNRTHPGKGS